MLATLLEAALSDGRQHIEFSGRVVSLEIAIELAEEAAEMVERLEGEVEEPPPGTISG